MFLRAVWEVRIYFLLFHFIFYFLWWSPFTKSYFQLQKKYPSHPPTEKNVKKKSVTKVIYWCTPIKLSILKHFFTCTSTKEKKCKKKTKNKKVCNDSSHISIMAGWVLGQLVHVHILGAVLYMNITHVLPLNSNQVYVLLKIIWKMQQAGLFEKHCTCNAPKTCRW